MNRKEQLFDRIKSISSKPKRLKVSASPASVGAYGEEMKLPLSSMDAAAVYVALVTWGAKDGDYPSKVYTILADNVPDSVVLELVADYAPN